MGPVLLILDLDEMLVYATTEPLTRSSDFDVGPFAVYERPFLSDFLTFAQANFSVAVWSSASADYVDAIVQRIVPKPADLAFVWARDRCTRRFDPEWQEEYWVKDLKKVKRVGYALDRVLIIDDTPKKLERNYGNLITLRTFEGDASDTDLRDLISYLPALANCTSLRKVEKRNWRTVRPGQ